MDLSHLRWICHRIQGVSTPGDVKDVYSQCLQVVALNLSTAYKNFFEKLAEYPRFKLKHHKQSISYPQNVRFEGDYIKLPKIGLVYWVCHREFEGKIKTVTVSKKPDGQYYASVLVDDGKEKPKPSAKDKAIGTLIIGHNEEWKQKINLGKRNNQNFVAVPYNKLIEMLFYKAKMVGINVILTEESYTSASSFIDNDLIPVYKRGQKNQVTFSPKRVKRCSAAKGGFPHERLHQDKEVCIAVPAND